MGGKLSLLDRFIYLLQISELVQAHMYSKSDLQ